jgi:hypothetical protein
MAGEIKFVEVAAIAVGAVLPGDRINIEPEQA